MAAMLAVLAVTCALVALVELEPLAPLVGFAAVRSGSKSQRLRVKGVMRRGCCCGGGKGRF